METSKKNAIVKAIELMNGDSIAYSQYELDVVKKRDGKKMDWSINIFQFSVNGDGVKNYTTLLSDPIAILILAKSIGAGFYIGVDSWKTRDENFKEGDTLPYIRLF